MKLHLPLLLLSALLSSFSSYAISMPENPGTSSPTVEIELLAQGKNEYVLDSDVTYTGPVCFRTPVDSVYDFRPGELVFTGTSGNENFALSGIVYAPSWGDSTIANVFSVGYDYNSKLALENLGSVSITNNKLLSVFQLVCRGDGLMSINNIKNDFIFSGNVSRGCDSEGNPRPSNTGFFYLYGMDLKGIKEDGTNIRGGGTTFEVSNIGGNALFKENSGGPIFELFLKSPGVSNDPITPGSTTTSHISFKNIGGMLEFSGNENGVFTIEPAGNTAETNDVFLKFDNIGQGVRFDGNTADIYSSSVSGIYVDFRAVGDVRGHQGQAFLSFSNIGGKGIEFLNGKGGAIYVNHAINAEFSITRSHNVSFIGNDYGAVANNKKGGGAVGYAVEKSVKFTISDIDGDVVFHSNKATNNGGAVYLYTSSADEGKASMSIANVQGDVSFNNNTAGTPYAASDTVAAAMGGAILLWAPDMQFLFENIGGNVEFSGNTASSNGGAIAFSGQKTLSAAFSRINGNLVFSGNNSNGWGGALYTNSNNNLFFGNIQGNIEFRNNLAAGAGGAIGVFAEKSNAVFSADGGDLIFSGNHDSGGDRANSISIRGNEAVLDFRARAGKSVILDDPLYYSIKTAGSEGSFETHLNRTSAEGVEYTGRIVFSGHLYSPDDGAGNLTSKILGNTTLHAGTLVLENGARYGSFGISDTGEIDFDQTEAQSFTMHNALLDINSTGDHADTVLSAQQVAFDTNSTLKPGDRAFLIARNVDLAKGAAFDLGYYLSGETEVPLNGLQIYATTLELGNKIALVDKGQKLEYYENTRWKSPHTFILADITNVDSVSGDFSGIFSQLSDSDIVEGFGYNGIWSYENKDGQLLAIWTPSFTPEPEKNIHPELAGNLTINSLWSTVSNMRALSRSALGQVGVSRFLLPKNTNYWALGLGDFSSHKSIGSLDGYDYNGFGYAVGADTHLADSLIGGLAFGNIYGKNKSRNFDAHIDQASYIGLAYASWSGELNKTNSLGIDGTASYGVTSNKLDTNYSDGDVSKGKWDNDALRFTLRGEWHHSLDENWTLSPFLGFEYDQAQQKSFMETGDKARQFGKSTLCNLALPAGLGISHRFNYSHGRQWINSLAVSYVPDIYRKNPEAATLRTTNGFTWTAEGLRPVRNAGRLEYSTRYQFNETWALFGGYSLEGRKNSFYHNANIGISAGF